MIISISIVASMMAPQWKLVLDQDFSGPAGLPPDSKVWVQDVGGVGWGNNESESYTAGPKNAYLDGKGNLVFEARKETTIGPDKITKPYSSARMHSGSKFFFRYGKIEARLKLPAGKGLWPAFWMMGKSVATAGWPAGGELDIMEFIGSDPDKVYGTLHGPGYYGLGGLQSTFTSKVPLSDDFHTYGIEWSPDGVKWFVDGHLFGQKSPNDVKDKLWVFDQPFYIIINLAVGGDWPGYPDETTVFPARMLIDYIRVYQDQSLHYDAKLLDKKNHDRVVANQEFKSSPIFWLPCEIPAADFWRSGGHSPTKRNEGGAYRPLGKVGIGGSGLDRIKYAVGWNKPGEWLEFRSTTASEGEFLIEAFVTCEGPGGKLALLIDGEQVGGLITVPNTGGWSNWKSVPVGKMTLKKGSHRIRLLFKEQGKSGAVGNILSIKLSKA